MGLGWRVSLMQQTKARNIFYNTFFIHMLYVYDITYMLYYAVNTIHWYQCTHCISYICVVHILCWGKFSKKYGWPNCLHFTLQPQNMHPKCVQSAVAFAFRWAMQKNTYEILQVSINPAVFRVAPDVPTPLFTVDYRVRWSQCPQASLHGSFDEFCLAFTCSLYKRNQTWELRNIVWRSL